MKATIPKEYKNIFGRSFVVGFECEFVFKNSDKLTQTSLGKRLKAIHPNIVLGYDSSIECDEDWRDDYTYDNNFRGLSGLEIKTPPLSTRKSLDVLHNTFELISECGFTNSSCGLHASFSPKSDEIYYKVDPFVILDDPLWGNMKKEFDRQDNEYCQSTTFNYSNRKVVAKKLRLFNDIMDGDINDDQHYNEVNFENYHEKRRGDSRIEVRCMGGKDYHKKFNDIAKNIHFIIATLKRGYGLRK